MKILSLDISSVSTGWALVEGNTLLDKGVIKLKAKTHGNKLFQFESALQNLITVHKPDIFAFEDIWKGPSIKTFKVLAFYHGIAYKQSFNSFKEDPIVLMPSGLRRVLAENTDLVLSGKREQDKSAVFDWVNNTYQLNYEFKKHNDITDAIAVGLAAAKLLELNENSVALAIKSQVKPKKPKKPKKEKKVKKTRKSKG